MESTKAVSRYYESTGTAHDGIFRCVDCRSLVTAVELRKRGTCACGTRRVKEITTLTFWEWLKIRIGWIDFPTRHQFLAEFRYER